MVETNAAITATFFVYLALMLGIGVWAYQSTKSSSGYFFGGRSLGPWPTAPPSGRHPRGLRALQRGARLGGLMAADGRAQATAWTTTRNQSTGASSNLRVSAATRT